MGTDADLLRRLIDEAFEGRNPAAIDELLSEDFVNHDPPRGMAGNRQGMRDIAEMVINAYPDRALEFDEIMETTDGRVVTSWAMNGTHTGAPFFGVPPTGQRIRTRGIEIWRCADGKIVEYWGSVDIRDFLMKNRASAG